MRVGSFFARAIVLFGLIVGPVAIAAAGILPNGSYRNSCTACTYDSNSGSLQCSCTAGGGWQNSTSLEVGDCSGDISNDDGELSCDAEGADISFLPTGSYEQSCSGCTYDPNSGVLQCSCTTGGGWQNSTSLEVGDCSGDISNNDGELSCD